MSINPRATYRLQLNGDFTLDDAASLADYLTDLGISHVYLSPILQATSGSAHGYDVVNPHQVSEELGGEAAFRRLAQTLQEHHMAILLDIVPNHMAIGPQNPWWWDVLENGRASLYAPYFDVEWIPAEESGAHARDNRILLPILGDHYGRILEAGEIKLLFDGSRSVITYQDNLFPVDPTSLATVLNRAAARVDSQRLDYLADSFASIPRVVAEPGSNSSNGESSYRRHRDQAILASLLQQVMSEEPESAAALNAVVDDINADPDALDDFLAQQNYRLAYWRVAGQELSYRRFFDINALIGLRMENERVFQDTHRLLLQWLNEGLVDGLRIDHPDGMRDPQGYFERLLEVRPPTWILVEKILEAEEDLPESWPVDGTTGYDFLNQVNALFVDPRGEEPLTNFYNEFTSYSGDYDEAMYQKKRLVIETILASDLENLTELFQRVTQGRRRYRDYTRPELREALIEVAACMPVYRTYARPDEKAVSLQDGLHVDEALQQALEKCAADNPNGSSRVDPELFDLLRDLLLLGVEGEVEADFVARFQQFTGPVMAKGVEDTTFYCYNRLLSLNEVGGNPGRFGLSARDFHDRAIHRQRFWPESLLATSTHDTKRSEDVRARLNVLSEIPEQWIAAVRRWSEQAQQYVTHEGLAAQPDANDQYLFYQTLVGAWPISEERMMQYMQKAVRESKRHSTWNDPAEAYESALFTFVHGVMADEMIMGDVEAFVAAIMPSGRVNSLAQTLLKLTAPGVPDIYQGAELWDLSLVDPDNRRPVDFDQRRRLLSALEASPAIEEIMAGLDEGLPKLWVIRQTLHLRAARPALFSPEAQYHPLPINGSQAALAFGRTTVNGDNGGDGTDLGLIVVVPRFTLSREENWWEATVSLPEGTWNNAFTDEIIEGGDVTLGALLDPFPVALLTAH